MRISDWSSDVCSSDLLDVALGEQPGRDIWRNARQADDEAQEGCRQNADSSDEKRVQQPDQEDPPVGGGRVHRDEAEADIEARLLPEKIEARGEAALLQVDDRVRSEEHTSEHKSLMR